MLILKFNASPKASQLEHWSEGQMTWNHECSQSRMNNPSRGNIYQALQRPLPPRSNRVIEKGDVKLLFPIISRAERTSRRNCTDTTTPGCSRSRTYGDHNPTTFDTPTSQIFQTAYSHADADSRASPDLRVWCGTAQAKLGMLAQRSAVQRRHRPGSA